MRGSGFLLDAHVPAAVADAVRAARGTCHIEHLARWRDGGFRQAPDAAIMLASLSDDLALVTYDVGTIPALLHGWMSEGRPIPPVVLISVENISPRDIGSITRALVDLYDDESPFEPDYPIVYLHLASP